MNAGKLDPAVSLAREHLTGSKEMGAKLLLAQLYSRTPNHLKDAVQTLQSIVASSGSADYLAMKYLADAFVLANPKSIAGACFLERSLGTITQSISSRISDGIEGQNEWRETQQAAEGTAMRDLFKALVDTLTEKGGLVKDSVGEAIPSDDPYPPPNHSLLAKTGLRLLDEFIDSTVDRSHMPYLAELEQLDEDQVRWLLATLSTVGPPPMEEEQKSALEL
jgi:hypothetical protein